MTIQLPLSPEREAQLRERASSLGKDLAGYVLEAVEEKLAGSDQERSELTAAERVHEWLKWTASHRPLGRIVDDSRETIYSGRGE